MIDVDALQTRIDTNPAVIAHAIDVIERGAKYPLTLQAIKDASEFDGSTTAAFLVELLEKEDKVEAFARQARMLFGEVLTVAPELNPHNDPNFATFRGDDTNAGATAAELGRFLIEAGSWSCRVFRDGEFAGSGLLVSPRLVLTAHHVCINATRELGKLSVEAGADARFRHRAAAYEQFHSPCHPEEWSGANPSADELEGHNDLALLWLDEPLGTQFGFYRVPETDIHLDGRVDCVVFHHPPTKNIDMSFGHIEVRPNKFERFPCSYGGTEPGSSGGAVFTNRQILIGHHQGRWREGLPELRRMVPLSYSRIVPTPNDPAQATDPDMPVKPEFLKTILDDRQPPSIWSLNSKLDGHLVIGRERFFASISNILSGRFPRIRGIHVIGDDQTDETSGESFSFSLLDSYLNAHEQTHVSAVRIPISSSDEDLFKMIALRLNLDQGDLELADGVRPGQTTPEAIDRERAKQLVAKIEKALASSDPDNPRSIWLHFEQGKMRPQESVRKQLEQFALKALHSRQILLLFTGVMSVSGIRPFSNYEQANGPGRPGLVLDRVAHFTREDVRNTARRISESFSLDLADDVLDDLVKVSLDNQVTNGTVQPPSGELYSTGDLGQVASLLKDEFIRRYPQLQSNAQQVGGDT